MKAKLIIALTIGVLLSGTALSGAYDNILAAANNNDNATVLDLIGRGMDVNTADPAGISLLMMAARNGNLPLLEALLVNRANPNRLSRHGDSAILLAALGGHVEAVRLLVKFKAEINPQGWAPLHYAVFGGHKAVIEFLLASGAAVDARAPNGQTAAMLAAKLGKIDLLKLLVEAKADVGLVDYSNATALSLALAAGNTEAAEYLQKTASGKAEK